jgi:inosose dehydratase
VNRSRRTLFQSTLATLASGTVARSAIAADARPPREPLKLGLASYSVRKLELPVVIERCRKLGIKYITLKDVHLPRDASPEQLASARAQIEAGGLTIMGGGNIKMPNDEAALRKDFEYAKTARLPLLVCSPPPDALDLVERLVKAYDIPVAIHNHGPEDKHYPTPLEILALIKKRDARMGICMDVGHTVRAGGDPVKLVNVLGPRLLDLHMNDLRAATPKPQVAVVGRGIVNIPALLKALMKRRFEGHVALEYEMDADDPFPGIRESMGYLRGVVAGLTA